MLFLPNEEDLLLSFFVLQSSLLLLAAFLSPDQCRSREKYLNGKPRRGYRDEKTRVKSENAAK